MSTLTQFGGGSEIGSIVPGIFPGNARYLPCDGVSTTPVTTSNANIAKLYPSVSSGSFTFMNSNFFGLRPYSIAYGLGMWVAVGAGMSSGTEVDTSYCLTSTDGINWMPRTLPVSRVWRNIAFNGTRFAAIGTTTDGTTTSTVFSVDGFSWVSGNYSATSTAIRYLATVGNQVWAVTAASGNAWYTDDGFNWVSGGTTGISTTMICGFKGRAYISDGSSVYVKHTGPAASNVWSSLFSGTGLNGMASSPSVMVISSNTTNATRVSTDGVTFNTVTAPAMYGVVWSGTAFIGFGAGSNVYSSANGTSWTLKSTGNIFTNSSQRWVGATDGTTAVAFDQANTPYYFSFTSNDGTSFNQYTLPKSGFASVGVNAPLAYSSTLGLYAIGGYSGSAGERQPILMTSPDGITWTERALETTSIVTGSNISQIVWNGSVFVATISSTNAFVLVSTDGLQWRYRATTITGSGGFITVGSAGKMVFTNTSGSYTTSTDGTTWAASTTIGISPIGIAWNGTVFAAMSGTGQVSTSPTANSGTWTAQTAQVGTFVNLASVGTYFVATISGSSSNILYSNTATGTWTTKALGLAVNSGRLSSDGTTMVVSSQTTSNTQFLSFTDPSATISVRTIARATLSETSATVMVANGQFMVPTYVSSVGPQVATVFTSPNGTTWNERSLGVYWNTILTTLGSYNSGVRFGGKTYFSSNYRHVIWTFEDNDTSLKARALPISTLSNPSITFSSIGTNGSLMVAIGYDVNNIRTVICTSTDGIDWVQRTTPTFPTVVADGAPTAWTNILWNGSTFVALSNSYYSMTSADGITWTAQVMPISVVSSGTCAVQGSTFYVPVVQSSSSNANNGYNQYLTSTDGITWAFKTSPIKNTNTATSALSFASDGTTVVMFPQTTSGGTSGALGFYGTDGNWTRTQAAGYGSSVGTVGTLLWTGNMFIVGTHASFDGKYWFNLGTSATGALVLGNNKVAFPGSSTVAIVSVDPDTIKSPNLNSSNAGNNPFYQLSLIVG